MRPGACSAPGFIRISTSTHRVRSISISLDDLPCVLQLWSLCG
jgi:hypothetical protein